MGSAKTYFDVYAYVVQKWCLDYEKHFIDKTYFNKLKEDILTEIARNMLITLNKNLKSKNIKLKSNNATLEYLVKNGTNEDFGARPLRRQITSVIEDELADMYLRGEIKDGNSVMVDCKDGKLKFLVK